MDKIYGEVVRIDCGIVPYENDVTKLTPEDEQRAADRFPYSFKMSGSDFYIELATAPSDCPFKNRQFGEVALGVCIECPQRIVELIDGTTIY